MIEETRETMAQTLTEISQAEARRRQATQNLLRVQERLEVIRANPARSKNPAEEAVLLNECISHCEEYIQQCDEFISSARFIAWVLPKYQNETETMADVMRREGVTA